MKKLLAIFALALVSTGVFADTPCCDENCCDEVMMPCCE